MTGLVVVLDRNTHTGSNRCLEQGIGRAFYHEGWRRF